MKRINKHPLAAFALACGFALLTACTADEAIDNSVANDDAIRFTATITGNPETRATIADNGTGSFENDDKISLFAYKGSPQSAPSIHTAAYTGQAWTFDLTWKDLGESSAEGSYYFVAYYPQQTPAEDGTFTFSVATDQSTDDAYKASDLLMATQDYTTKPDKGIVALAFSHQMACIQVTLEQGKDVTDDELKNATVTIQNVTTDCTVSYDGTLTTGSNKDNVTPKKSTAFYALVPPQSVADGGLELSITAAGQTISYKAAIEENLLTAGNLYPITLTLKKGDAGGEPEPEPEPTPE